MERTIILKGGIWKKGERQLIAEVKNHPELYEENGRLRYGIEKYETSWKEVAKQVGESVTNCKKQWSKIQFDYENHTNKSGKHHKTKFSKYLDGTLDFLKQDLEVISVPKTDTELNPVIDFMCLDSESSDTSDQEKTENDFSPKKNVRIEEVNIEKGSELVLVDTRKRILGNNTKNEKMFGVMKLKHKDTLLPSKKSRQSRLKRSGSVKLSDDLLNLSQQNNKQNNVAYRKPSIEYEEEIPPNACSDTEKSTTDDVNTKQLVQDSGSLKSITSRSKQVRRKNSCEDEEGWPNNINRLKSIKIDNVKVKRKQTNAKKSEAGASKIHTKEFAEKSDVGNISGTQCMFGKMTLNKARTPTKRLKTKIIQDSNKPNSNFFLKKLLNNKFQEPVNRGSNKSDFINKVSSNNDKIVNIIQGDASNNVNENPTSVPKSNDSLDSSPNIDSSPKVTTPPPVVYIATNSEGQAVCVTPVIMMDYFANSPNISSEMTLSTHNPTVVKLPKDASSYVQPMLIENIPDSNSHTESEDIGIKEETLNQNLLPESSHNKDKSSKEKLDSILHVNAEESNMNVFFDQVAEYVTNTYALEKQLDIRSKICAIVQTATQKFN